MARRVVSSILYYYYNSSNSFLNLRERVRARTRTYVEKLSCASIKRRLSLSIEYLANLFPGMSRPSPNLNLVSHAAVRKLNVVTLVQ